jgi:hypothetical protein
MKPRLRRSGLALLGLAIAIQLWPVGRTNPPVTADLEAPSDVRAILRRSCYDCHSHETRWPWYAWVAPVSWLVVDDVDTARKALDFSRWGEYTATKRRSKRDALLDQVEEGSMPPKKYVRMHSGTAVSPEDIEILKRWVEAPAGSESPSGSEAH